jgi:Leucine-rich repeat (LRR) protein
MALSLPSRNLAGTLSPAIGNLTFLRLLNLSSNGLHGEIPETVGRLRRLRAHNIGRNSISGVLPANLSSCVSLTDLRLHYNQRIPADLGNTLTRIQIFALRNNSLTGPIPAGIGSIAGLQHLSLSGEVPPSLWNLSSLVAFQELAARQRPSRHR